VYFNSGKLGIASYNPVADSWNTGLATTSVSSGASFSANAVTAFNNKIYVFGYTSSTIFAYAYNPVTNSWAPAGSVDIGSGANGVAATTLNGSVYVGYSYISLIAQTGVLPDITFKYKVGTTLYYYTESSFSNLSLCTQNNQIIVSPGEELPENVIVGVVNINQNSVALLAYGGGNNSMICQVSGNSVTTTTTPSQSLTNYTLSAVASVENTFAYTIDTTTDEIIWNGASASVIPKQAPPSGFSSGNAAAVYYNGYIYFIGSSFNYAYPDPLYYAFQKN
jgi:hypothetical protein